MDDMLLLSKAPDSITTTLPSVGMVLVLQPAISDFVAVSMMQLFLL